MPIEFLCSGCKKRLRVPDDTAGKTAKCPNCATVLTVPASSSRDPETTSASDSFASREEGGGVSPSHSSAPASRSPYAPPTDIPASAPSIVPGELSVQPIDAGLALSTAWELFKNNAGILIGAYVITIAFSAGISVFGGVVQVVLVGVFNDPDSPAVVLTNFAVSILNQVIQLWLAIGFLRINLAVARNQPAEIGMLYSGGPYLLRYIGGAIIFGIALFVGFLLLIVPGIYIALTYWSYMYFLVDRNCGVRESFELASRHASGNRFNAFRLGLISIGLFLLGLLACGVGLLITIPITMLMIAIAYLMMSGQRFAQPMAAA